MGKPLPVVALENLKVASPCHAAWDDMHGDERVRFCGSCQKNVFNLSEMSREDAEALITRTEGRLCVRFYRRGDGTVLTQDCPVGLAAVRRRLAWIGAAVAAGLGVVAAFVGLRPAGGRTHGGQTHVLMGDVAAPTVKMGRIAAPVDPTPPPPPPVMGEVDVDLVQGGVAPIDSAD